MSLKDLLTKEEARYQRLLEEIEADNVQVEGRLEVSINKQSPQYYWIHTNPQTGKKEKSYLREEDGPLKVRLVKAGYYKDLKKKIKTSLTRIRALNRAYHDGEIEEIYQKLHPLRKSLVEPIEPLLEDELAAWAALPYPRKSFDQGSDKIFSKKGDRVRSKTEKILADTFYDHGLVYKYECPLYLQNGATLHPDFTFFNPKKKLEIYWEHMGMMDNWSYASRALTRIHQYEMNGIFPGKQLIISYEWSNRSLSSAWVDRIIKEYLRF